MVFPEDLKGWRLGRQKLQVSCWTQTSGKNSPLPSQHLTLSPTPGCVAGPSVPVAFGRETRLLPSQRGY